MIFTSQGAVDWVYANDTRGHRHRCRCCNKVITAGEPVVIARVTLRRTSGSTWAVHKECGDKRHSPEYSWREVLDHWSRNAT